MWSCLKYLLWNSKDLFPCCFAFLFHTGYICLFLLQCTLAGGNFLPSGDWWLNLHKDPKNLSQWDFWPNRSVFPRSSRTDVSTELRSTAVNAVCWNALPQVTKHAHKNRITITDKETFFLWIMFFCFRIYTLIHFVAYADTEIKSYRKQSHQVSQWITHKMMTF